VRFRLGLRSEIIINISMLLTAALLFSGFLLTRLLERELIAQRVTNVTDLMEVVAGNVSQEGMLGDAAGNEPVAESVRQLQKLSSRTALRAWAVADKDGKALAVSAEADKFRIDESALANVKYADEPVVQVVYDGFMSPFRQDSKSSILITVPLNRRETFVGALQARFDLSEVRVQIASAQKLILLYTGIYGGILALFGVYILGRSVLSPVRNLREMSQRIAAGDLEHAVPLQGPVEIADLAASFNSMMVAIRQGKLEREDHIHALQQANEEVRRAQDDLIRSEKMASVGHLAAGMAHEIGNPLGAVVGYLEYLKSEAAPGRAREIIERALAETGRIDRLVRELLDYAVPADGRLQLFDPVGAMAEARDILAHQGLFEGVVLDDRLPPVLPPTHMDRHKLVQVCINLLLNARDALAAGGAIRLCAGEEVGGLWLAVADTGAGMAAEVLAHIFDPFYSTKEPGKGRGLGLAVCQRVVGEAGGRIEVVSVPGEGSEFKVWLPKAESEEDDA